MRIVLCLLAALAIVSATAVAQTTTLTHVSPTRENVAPTPTPPPLADVSVPGPSHAAPTAVSRRDVLPPQTGLPLRGNRAGNPPVAVTPSVTVTPGTSSPPDATPTVPSDATGTVPGAVDGRPGRVVRRGRKENAPTPTSAEAVVTPISAGSPLSTNATVTPTATSVANKTPQAPTNTTPTPGTEAKPSSQQTPFVPSDLPQRARDRRRQPNAAATMTPAASETGTPTAGKASPSPSPAATDLVPTKSSSSSATPSTDAVDKSSAVTPPAGKQTPFVPADMPERLREKRDRRQTPVATETPAETQTPKDTPVATVAPKETKTPGAASSPSPAPTSRADRSSSPTVAAAPRGPAVDVNSAPAAALTGPAATLFKREKDKGKKKDPTRPELTPMPDVSKGTDAAAAKTDVTVYNPPPAGSTPTPTPAPQRIKVSKKHITDVIQNITLAPTPPPAPTPGVTPVPTPPNVTPTPSVFKPAHNWKPYPGWSPPPSWKPPVGYVPPGGWSPPPGWTPPDEEWRRRCEHWGWRYIARRGWVVDVRWVPPADFIVPPNWYYLPPTSYDDYGFYNPSEVVIIPGRARPDLVVNINVGHAYVPPQPPPVLVEQAPPPPPRELPPAPIAPVVVEDVQEVAQVLTRERQPGGNRYDGPVLVTGAIHFDYDDYSIKPESFPSLDRIGEALTQPPLEEAIINVEGHTDSDGSDEYNQTLSERRAWSVKSYLVQKFGMDPNRLVIVGYGERAPIASNNSDQGKAQNRRVEFENVTDLYNAQVLETGSQEQ